MLFNLYGFLLRKAVFLLKKPRVSVMAPRPGGGLGRMCLIPFGLGFGRWQTCSYQAIELMIG